MKKQKQIRTCLFAFLAAVLMGGVLTIPVMAEPVENGEATVPVHWNQEATAIDVTLTDRVWIDAAADTVTATVTPVTVTNNLSSVGIQVTGIQADGTNSNGYTLEDYGSDFTAYAADSHKYALAYNEADLQAGVATEDAIEASGSLVYDFGGKLSIATETVTQADEKAVGNLVFTIGLSIDDGYFHPTRDMMRGTAYAVGQYNDSSNKYDLIFFRSEENYDAYDYNVTGQKYDVTDIMGNTYHGAVFTGIETIDTALNNNRGMPWVAYFRPVWIVNGNSYVAEGQAIKPKNLKSWFDANYQCCFDTVDLTRFDLSEIESMESAFWGCDNIILTNAKMENLRDMQVAFAGCSNGIIDCRGSYFGNVTNVTGMFGNQHHMTLYFTDADFSSVTDVGYFGLFDIGGSSGMSSDINIFMDGVDFSGLTAWSYSHSFPDGSETHLSYADFSNLSNTTQMFKGGYHSLDLSYADFRNAVDATEMFSISGREPSASASINLDYADFRNVKYASHMLDGYMDGFTLSLNETRFDSLEDASYMFATSTHNAADSLYLGDSFDFSHVIDATSMFSGWSEVTIENPDFRSVTNADEMFEGCSTININHADFRSLENVARMFTGDEISYYSGTVSVFSFVLNMSHADFSSLRDASDLFYIRYYSKIKTINLEYADFSNLESCDYFLFDNSFDDSFVINLNHANFGNATSAEQMLYDGHNDDDVSGVIYLNDTDFHSLISGCQMFNTTNSMLELRNADFSSLEDASSMFSCDALDVSDVTWGPLTDTCGMFGSGDRGDISILDLSTMDTSAVTDMSYMFQGLNDLNTIYVGTGWSTESVLYSDGMFEGCDRLPHFDSSYTDASKAYHEYDPIKTDGLGYLTYKGATASVTIEDEDLATGLTLGTQTVTIPIGQILHTDKIRPTRYVKTLPDGRDEIYAADTNFVQTIPITGDMTIIRKFKQDDEAWYDGTAYAYFDYNENKLTFFRSEESDPSVISNQGWVKDLNGVVYDTTNGTLYDRLEEEDFSASWYSNSDYAVEFVSEQKIRPKTISYWFSNCASVSGLSQLDTSLCSDMNNAFSYAKVGELDLSGWNTSNVTNMNGMFYYCDALASLNLSGWDTSQVTNMSYMFYGCDQMTVLDLSDLDTSRVESMDYMFSPNHYSSLEHIYVGDGWTTSALSNGGEYNGMFFDCTHLSDYNEEYTDASKAYVGEGGYLEMKP